MGGSGIGCHEPPDGVGVGVGVPKVGVGVGSYVYPAVLVGFGCPHGTPQAETEEAPTTAATKSESFIVNVKVWVLFEDWFGFERKQ